jgi:hypothetical protein
MTNAWVVNDDPFVRWIADLSAVHDRSQRLLDWRRTVLEAGARQAVYRVVEGEPFVFVAGGLAPAEDGQPRVLSRVAYFDRKGAIAEAEVDDLGGLLRSLRPEDVETAGFLMKHSPPLDLREYGLVLRRPDGTPSGQVVLRVAFALYSDIWLPWALGLLEDDYGEDLFDNRPLAERHTPRLNDFLSAARQATVAAGGRWYLDRDDTRPDVLAQVGDEGVQPDVERPAPAPPLPPEPSR